MKRLPLKTVNCPVPCGTKQEHNGWLARYMRQHHPGAAYWRVVKRLSSRRLLVRVAFNAL